MNSHVLVFCLFIVPNLAYINGGPVRDVEEINANLDNHTRWVRELTILFAGTTGEDPVIDVTMSTLAPVYTSREPVQIKFLLYTRTYPDRGERLVQNDIESVKQSSFKKSIPTVFITHGWMNSDKSASCGMLRFSYLAAVDVNVIVIDWSDGAEDYLYHIAASKVPKVGKAVGNFMEWLSDNDFIVVSETVLVGHSLGAHVVGIAGYTVTGLPKAIYGLDPALPLFNYAGPRFRISTLDAKHVQVIHTNAGILGTNRIWGHVDFYMNGGTYQPICLGIVECPHTMVLIYFSESLEASRGFYGLKCNSDVEVKLGRCSGPSYGRMGGYIPDEVLKNGEIYMVPVNSEYPFSIGRPT